VWSLYGLYALVHALEVFAYLYQNKKYYTKDIIEEYDAIGDMLLITDEL
jgi:hypothetical protein